MKTILYVEDDLQIQKAVINFLSHHEYHTIGLSNANDAINYLTNFDVDLVLLDLGLPDLSGEELCVWIKKNHNLPIIMITAKIDEDFVVNGFRLGAKDYIKKPFGLKELLVRIEAILKSDDNVNDNLSFNNKTLVINLVSHEIKVCGEYLEITEYEYKILKLLAKNTNQVFSREQIITGAFGYEYDGYERTIDSHIKNIRNKLKTKTNISFIKTTRGIGYKFIGVNDDEKK